VPIQTVREDIMRSTITAFAFIGGLVASDPGHAQGTSSPSVTPKQPAAPIAPAAPVGHRQPRPSDVQTGANPSPPAPVTGTTGSGADDLDAQLNRVLNGICRGC